MWAQIPDDTDIAIECLDGWAYPKTVEYLDGVAYAKVSPRVPHWVVQSNMLVILRALAGDRGLVGPELHVQPGRVDKTKTIFVPDVSFVSWERLRAMKPSDDEEPTSPDIAVEVRSPSNRKRFIADKIARLLATGTVLVLDVQPKSRTIVAHDGKVARTFSCGEIFEHPAAEWLRFEVSEAFVNLDKIEGRTRT